jgi:hypothetical protein
MMDDYLHLAEAINSSTRKPDSPLRSSERSKKDLISGEDRYIILLSGASKGGDEGRSKT